MYACTHGQPLCLVYEDFYLAIDFTFYEFINNGDKKKACILFYNPRRTQKYRVSKDSHYETLNDAVKALSVIYKKPPAWIKKHMGSTNNLAEIHRSLSAEIHRSLSNEFSTINNDSVTK